MSRAIVSNIVFRVETKWRQQTLHGVQIRGYPVLDILTLAQQVESFAKIKGRVLTPNIGVRVA